MRAYHGKSSMEQSPAIATKASPDFAPSCCCLSQLVAVVFAPTLLGNRSDMN
jgi:hypothetical protein